MFDILTILPARKKRLQVVGLALMLYVVLIMAKPKIKDHVAVLRLMDIIGVIIVLIVVIRLVLNWDEL